MQIYFMSLLSRKETAKVMPPRRLADTMSLAAQNPADNLARLYLEATVVPETARLVAKNGAGATLQVRPLQTIAL